MLIEAQGLPLEAVTETIDTTGGMYILQHPTFLDHQKLIVGSIQ